MLFSNLLGIYCFYCKKYYNPCHEVYLHLHYEGSITCPENHLCGNESDPQWKEFVGEEDEKEERN